MARTSQYLVEMVVDGTGVQFGGLSAGLYTWLYKATGHSDLMEKLNLGPDCVKLSITVVGEDRTVEPSQLTGKFNP